MVSLDTIFDLLSSENRRYALYYLTEQDGPVSVNDLVGAVAEWEDTPPTKTHLEQFEQVKVELQHNDLPKSAEVDFIKYDQDEELIQIQGEPPEFEAFVAIARIIERPATD